MKRRRWMAFVLLLVVILGGLWFAASRASLSTLNDPSPLELYAATKAKRWLVARSARGIQPSPAGPQDVVLGGMQFRARCASCHGLDGRTPTDIGRALYPRVADLGSTDIQQWSDAELFWIVKNGIRLSGMPGFGKMLTDEEIWPLVRYIRSLRPQSEEQRNPRTEIGSAPNAYSRESRRSESFSPDTVSHEQKAGGARRLSGSD